MTNSVFGDPFGQLGGGTTPQFVNNGASAFTGSTAPQFANSTGGGNQGALVNQTGLGQISQNAFVRRPSALAQRGTGFAAENALFNPGGAGNRTDAGQRGEGGFFGDAVSPDLGSFARSVGTAIGFATNPGIAALGIASQVALGKTIGQTINDILDDPFGLNDPTPGAPFGHTPSISEDDIGAPNTPAQDVDIASQVDSFSDIPGAPPGSDASMGQDSGGIADSSGIGNTDGADPGVGGGADGEGGGCVIATHALASGAFTATDKRRAVVWCEKRLHGHMLGEAFRRGYRWHGKRAIRRGEADRHYAEFKAFTDFVTGRRRTLMGAAIVVWRAVQFTATGAFVRR